MNLIVHINKSKLSFLGIFYFFENDKKVCRVVKAIITSLAWHCFLKLVNNKSLYIKFNLDEFEVIRMNTLLAMS